MNDFNCQYAVKYKLIKITDTWFILAPISVLIGEETETGFKANTGKEYPAVYDSIDTDHRFYVDMIYTDDELKYLYDEDDDVDLELLGDYFFEKLKNTIIFIDTNDVTKSGMLYRTMIDLNVIKEDLETAIYYMDDSLPNVVLNDKAVREIMDAKSLKKVKLIMNKYQQGLTAINKLKETEDINRVSITNNHVNYFEINKNIDLKELIDSYNNVDEGKDFKENKDVSYQGLRKYIKERIFGHDNEIDTFAQKLYMNYTALPGETVESIMFVGPTGTGKTETVRAASNYLCLPMFETNASNLVAEGYVGTSIEGVILSLYENAGYNIKRAERGIVFLDEFDKLSDVSSGETKGPVKNILLTFTAGGSFPISRDHYNFIFDSSMTNKIYAGVFERVTDKVNPMGFGAATKRAALVLETDEEIRKKIIEKKYYTQEELTRISTILAYNDLPRETKKDALLHSKISEYVKKNERYSRQFGIELIMDEECIDALLESQNSNSTGMRNIYNTFKRIIDPAEKAILENETKGYKKLILTRETVDNPNKFDLSK